MLALGKFRPSRKGPDEAIYAGIASVFAGRWVSAVRGKVPDSLRDQPGIAIAKRTYEPHRALLTSPRWQAVFNAGPRPQWPSQHLSR
jgi:hypothetical protein